MTTWPRPLASLTPLLCSALLLSAPFGVGCGTDDAAVREETPETPARPIFFWRAERVGSPGVVYLLGSVHVQRGVDAGLDQAVVDVLDRADELVFEVHPDHTRPHQLREITLRLGLYTPPETIQDHIDDRLWTRSAAAARQLGLPNDVILRMRPWLLALTISVTQAQQQGYDDEEGVEEIVQRRAGLKGAAVTGDRAKRVSALETPEDQLLMFAEQPADVQVAMLEDALTAFDEPDSLGELQAAYLKGDEAALEKTIFGEIDPVLEPLNRAVFDDRNVKMTRRLLPFFDAPQTTMVTVGVGHLVGDASIIKLLREEGVDVTRVAGTGPADPPKLKQAASDSAGAEPGEPNVHKPHLGFACWMPGPASEDREAREVGPGAAITVTTVAHSVDASLELAVVVTEFPTPLAPDLALQLMDVVADKELPGLARELGGRVDEVREDEVQGVRAIYGRSVGPQRFEGYVFVHDGLMYRVLAFSKGESDDATARAQASLRRRFFASIRLTERSPPKQSPTPKPPKEKL